MDLGRKLPKLIQLTQMNHLKELWLRKFYLISAYRKIGDSGVNLLAEMALPSLTKLELCTLYLIQHLTLLQKQELEI